MTNPSRDALRRKRHERLRLRITGTAERPRLSVFRSAKYIYAQVIDDTTGRTLAQANSQETAVKSEIKAGAASKAAARRVGELIAERAKSQGVEHVVFDRGGYVYHGKVKEIADGARAKGLQF
jgi:large subunit ribosomal protein L18